MRTVCVFSLLAVVGLAGPAVAADPKDSKGVWTDPADPTLPVDFKIQGEYAAGKLGVQVVALGKGTFQAVVLPGGLPGAGWDGTNKSLLAGKLDGETAKFTPTTGRRKYLAQHPDEFSATSKFPPTGQTDYTGTAYGRAFALDTPDGKMVQLKKVERKSPTLGAKPPEGALVLFDGTDHGHWVGGRFDEKTKVLNTDGKDIRSKNNFNNYTVHLEFMLPFKPDGRGQGRGNSGFYQVLMYEVQVLDSFGLEGKNNECGGVYTKADPKVNMCLPPLAWQTYDIDFTNAVAEGGKVVKKARLTCKHNGVVIHDDIEIDGKTGGARNDPEGTPGPLLLQGHGNPLQYGNIWIVEKK
jgi:3-keto-disaccharide hydrolase